MTEPRAEYTADEIITPELMAEIRVDLRTLMARGHGRLVISVKNHCIDIIEVRLPKKWNGGNTTPID